MGSCETLFLKIQPYLISHLKLVWHPMLIVALLLLGVGFLQNFVNLLLNVMDSLNKFGCSINLDLSMGVLFLCKSYVNGGQWMEPQAHLKRVVVNRVVEGSIVAMMNIRNALIPCAYMFGVIHPQDMDNHLIGYLCFSISLWVEGNRFGQLGVHNLPLVGPKILRTLLSRYEIMVHESPK
jgi:hypothetical protein